MERKYAGGDCCGLHRRRAYNRDTAISKYPPGKAGGLPNVIRRINSLGNTPRVPAGRYRSSATAAHCLAQHCLQLSPAFPGPTLK